MKSPFLAAAAVAILLVAVSSVHAQFELQYRQFGDINTQWRQPASLGFNDFVAFSGGINGGLYAGVNSFTLKGVFGEDGTITEETRERIVDQMGTNNYAAAGANLGPITGNFKLGILPLGVYISDRTVASVHWSNPGTIGLVLLGNKPYAGTTVSDEDVFAHLYRYKSIGVGTAFGTDKFRLGVRVNALLGNQAFSLSDVKYNLFTSDFGDSIHVDAGYKFSSTDMGVGLFNFQGMGAGIDLGVVVKPSDKLSIELAAIDIGMISYDGKIYDNQNVATNWTGINISSLFSDSVNTSSDIGADTLRSLLIPDSTTGKFTMMLPGKVSAGLNLGIGDAGLLYVQAGYGLFGQSPAKNLPYLAGGYQHTLGESLTVGANVQAGGTDMYAFGLMSRFHTPIGDGRGLAITLASDNILGWFLGSTARGLNLYGGVSINL